MMKKACFLTIAAGIACGSYAGATDSAMPVGITAADMTARRSLAAAMLPVMPAAHRAAIIDAGGLGSEGYLASMLPSDDGALLVAADDRYALLRDAVSPALFARMSETHLESLLYLRARGAESGVPIAQCFAPGTDPELVAAYELIFREQFWAGEDPDNRFELVGRWTATATDGFSSVRGDPITLTYSFAPDGSPADNLFGQNRSSQLFSWLNSIYGSPATWQALFDSVFQNWGDLIGVTYVREFNDDGVEANSLPGSLGVRGDVRIFAVNLDGNFNVLAYNQFPNGGDMVFDAFDNFFNSTSQQSRNLRNVAAHEHGHGLGFAHSCPQNGTKLMEPSANTNFNGPQLDDILAGQRFYGDASEPSDNAGEATDLGSWFVGRSESRFNLTIDDGDDRDFFRLDITQPMELVVVAEPDAGSYRTGPQNPNGSCSSGTINNFDDNQDLTLELVSSNGTTRVAFSNSTGLEQAEELRVSVTTPGTYYLIVDGTASDNGIQRYAVSFDADQIPFDGPTIAASGDLPQAALPGQSVTIDFDISANSDSITSGPDLLYRVDGGAFTRTPLASQGGGVFRATVPGADCDQIVEYYIEVVGAIVGAVNLPAAGPAAPFGYSIGELSVTFSEDFENPANGWDDNISTASAGDWEVGTPDGLFGAPASDFDGSGQCYLTGAAFGVDVDSGRTLLRTPPIDFSNGGVFDYAYYLSGNGGPVLPGTLRVEVSFNGQITWTELRSYDADSAGWQTDSIEIDAADGVPSTFIRFIAEDDSFTNTVECAIDAVSVSEITCSEPGGCNAADLAVPFDVLDLGDISAFIAGFTGQTAVADLAAPFGVWDLGDISAFIAAFTGGCP